MGYINNKLVEKAREYATEKHKSVNHYYDNQPYEIHLRLVFGFAHKYSYLITENIVETLASAWTHDVIEDCRETYNDVKLELGKVVADISYVLTNLKGRTRDERAGSAYYEGIREVEGAVFIKICDRLANTMYSRNKESSMFERYKIEYVHFKKELYQERYSEMFEEIEELMK